jgi:hypothetical protein
VTNDMSEAVKKADRAQAEFLATKPASKALPKKRPRRSPKRQKQTEDRLAAALVAMRREKSDDPAAEEFREELFAELRKLIPQAISQAKKGKPALLRILTRYSR